MKVKTLFPNHAALWHPWRNWLMALLAAWLPLLAANAQASHSTDSTTTRFKVSGFKVLPNDISAFITPVRDLNGDACALVKVVAQKEFAFSSPLGIVKRKNEVGEIWLYLPHGTKLLTIKHPRWGVLRDYRFSEPLEGRMAYELKIETPRPDVVHTRDTVFFTRTVTDTVIVDKHTPQLPWRMHGLLTVSLHDRGPSWGIMFAMLRRHGFFVHAQSDLRRLGTTPYTCDREGFLPGSEIKPYYTGETRRATHAFTAGMAHHLRQWLAVFYGVGYGRSSLAWQLADSEGGGYALNDGLSCKGIAAEAGLLLSFKRFNLSASTLTIAGKQWQASIGVGFRIWKSKK